MSFQALTRPTFMAPHFPFLTNTPAVANISGTLNDTNDRIAVVMAVEKTGTIDAGLVRTGTVAGTNTLQLALETVNTADNNPSGTLLAAGASGVQAAVASNTVYEIPLTTPVAVTAGQKIAIVASLTSVGTSVIMSSLDRDDAASLNGLPYGRVNVTGAYAASTEEMMVALQYDDGVWVPVGPTRSFVSTVTTAVINTGTTASTGLSRGLFFQVPYTCQIDGLWVQMAIAAGANFLVECGDGSPSPSLTTVATWDGDQVSATGVRGYFIPFTTPQTILPNTNYRIVFTPTTANGLTLYEYTVTASHNEYLDAAAMGGKFFIHTALINGTWVETDVRGVWMSPRISHLPNVSTATVTVNTVLGPPPREIHAPIKLSEATAVRRRIKFTQLDATTGAPRTGLGSWAASDIRLSKNGEAEANAAGTVTEKAGGDYYYNPIVGEIDTLGDLEGRVVRAGSLVTRFLVPIVAEDKYDVVSGGHTGNSLRPMLRGSVATDVGNTALTFKVDATLGAYAANAFRGLWVRITSGALADQIKPVSASGAFITVSEAFTGIPADGVTIELVGTGSA